MERAPAGPKAPLRAAPKAAGERRGSLSSLTVFASFVFTSFVFASFNIFAIFTSFASFARLRQFQQPHQFRQFRQPLILGGGLAGVRLRQKPWGRKGFSMTSGFCPPSGEVSFRIKLVAAGGAEAPEGATPHLLVVFDPLEGSAMDDGIADCLRGRRLRLGMAPVHLIPGSIAYSEYFLSTGTLFLPKNPPDSRGRYFGGLSREDYVDMLMGDGFLRDVARGRHPRATGDILANTRSYLKLFGPGEAPGTPYLLWANGPTVLGQPGFKAKGGDGPSFLERAPLEELSAERLTQRLG
jgi:hypothetical protein